MTASSSTDLLGLRIWWSNAAALASTCHLGFWLLLHAPVNTHAPATRRNLLLMSSDVTGWRQQPRKQVHVSPSPCQRHVIGWRHRLYCSTRDPTRNRPGPVSVDFDLGPVDFDFDFLRWPLTKSQNFRQGLSCSVFRVDSNFELCFFSWSSKIGQLAHSSLWFL